MINKHERYEKQLEVNFEKCQEGRGTWYELRFTYQQLEVIATGGLFSKKTNGNKIDAFLGVAAPSHMAHDTHFVLLAPAETTALASCSRTLRNYQKKSSLFKWCFKSSFFKEMGSPLRALQSFTKVSLLAMLRLAPRSST